MAPLSREDLVHTHPGMKVEDFMAAIDKTGGWPVGYKCVQFYHAVVNSGRTCIFTNNDVNTGWWTTVCRADDYYWRKLSDAKKAKVLKDARRQLIRQLQ